MWSQYRREWVHSDTSICENDIYTFFWVTLGCLFDGIEGQYSFQIGTYSHINVVNKHIFAFW